MPVEISSIIEQGKELLAPAGTTLSDTWQALIGDRVAAWRITNAIKLQIQVNAELLASGLKLKESRIPDRYAFTWFEEATKQDKPELQTLFARLLARAASGDEDALDHRHLETVSRLTPLDAVILSDIYNYAVDATAGWGRKPEECEREEHELHKSLKVARGDNSWRSVEHLQSLGLLERRTAVNKHSLEQVFRKASVDPRRGISLGMFGADLEMLVTIVTTDTGWSLYRALREEEAADHSTKSGAL